MTKKHFASVVRTVHTSARWISDQMDWDGIGVNIEEVYDAIDFVRKHMLEEHGCDQLSPMHPVDWIFSHHKLHGEDIPHILHEALKFIRDNS